MGTERHLLAGRGGRLLLAGAVGVGLLTSTSSLAYVLIGWNWSWQANPMSDPFVLSPTSFPSSTGNQTNITNALRNGMNRWGDDGTADFAFTDGGLGTTGNHIAKLSSTTASGGTLAVSASYGFGTRMTDCDITFYNANAYGTIDWIAQTGSAPGSRVDLEQVATHEFGHCAGLDHSATSGAVMYPSYRGGSTVYRQLGQDDKNGLIAMYGNAAPSLAQVMDLEIMNPVFGGDPVTVRVTGANGNERITLLASLLGEGDGPCRNEIGGKCIALLAPVVPVMTRTANAQGTVSFTFTVPAQYAGYDGGYQAVAIRGSGGANSVGSDTQAYPILAPSFSCQAGWVPDCNALCVPSSFVDDGYCDDGTNEWNSAATGFVGYSDFFCAMYDYDVGDCP